MARIPTSFDEYLAELGGGGLPCSYMGESWPMPRRLPALTQLLFARAADEDPNGTATTAEIEAAVVPLTGRKRLKRWRRAWDKDGVPPDVQDEQLALFLGYALARYSEALVDQLEVIVGAQGDAPPGEANAPTGAAPRSATSSTSGN
jgi:hypothetical protein